MQNVKYGVEPFHITRYSTTTLDMAVWCGLECVLWDSAMCNLYLKCGDVHGVV